MFSRSPVSAQLPVVHMSRATTPGALTLWKSWSPGALQSVHLCEMLGCGLHPIHTTRRACKERTCPLLSLFPWGRIA